MCKLCDLNSSMLADTRSCPAYRPLNPGSASSVGRVLTEKRLSCKALLDLKIGRDPSQESVLIWVVEFKFWASRNICYRQKQQQESKRIISIPLTCLIENWCRFICLPGQPLKVASSRFEIWGPSIKHQASRVTKHSQPDIQTAATCNCIQVAWNCLLNTSSLARTTHKEPPLLFLQFKLQN